MHALMPAVLLGMSWLNAFDLDAEPEPPDCELAEAKESVGACERSTVVRANSARQAVFLKDSLEDRKDAR
jgi:hypothetical protein